MKNSSKRILLIIGIFIILIGGVIPSLPNSWLTELPAWIKNLSIFCGIAIIILNIFWFLQDIDELNSKNKKMK